MISLLKRLEFYMMCNLLQKFFKIIKKILKPKYNTKAYNLNKDNVVVVISEIKSLAFTEYQNKRLAQLFSDKYIVIKDINCIKDNDFDRIEVFIGSPPKDKVVLMKNLKWLQLPSSGTNGYEVKSLYYRENYPIITTASGVFSIPIAEYVLTMLLFLSKSIIYKCKKNKRPPINDYKYGDFSNNTVLIIGLGSIGCEVAKRIKGLGVKVIAIKRDIEVEYDFIDELYKIDNLNNLLKISDFVVLCLPESDDTNNIIDIEQIKIMKRNAIIVNVGRGNAINQEAIIFGIRNKLICGAALDVTMPDPLPQLHRLWKYDNVILTSHKSYMSSDNNKRAFELFYSNCTNYLMGKPMQNTYKLE